MAWGRLILCPGGGGPLILGEVRGGGGGGTSKSTGRSGRQNAATRRNMRREERVTVQGPVKKQQPDGMSHRGGGVSALLGGWVELHRCPWAEAHCAAWGAATSCRPGLLYNFVMATKEFKCGMIIRDHPNAIREHKRSQKQPFSWKKKDEGKEKAARLAVRLAVDHPL